MIAHNLNDRTIMCHFYGARSRQQFSFTNDFLGEGIYVTGRMGEFVMLLFFGHIYLKGENEPLFRRGV